MKNELVKQTGVSLATITEEEITSFLDLYGFGKIDEKEKGQFLKVCQMNGLNPFNREAYIVAYGEGKYRNFSIITGFQVYLKRAEATGLLTGWKVGEVEACKTAKIVKDKPILIDDLKVSITIHRSDFMQPFEHTVKYSEMVKKKKDGTVTEFWLKPEMMLKKVVMGQGFRLCFSGALGQLPYTDAEMNTQIHDAESEDITDQNAIAPVAEDPKKTISEKELSELIHALQNFEITKAEALKKYKGYVMTEQQKIDINKAAIYTDEQLSEIVEIVNSGKRNIKDFQFSITPKQMEEVENALMNLEADEVVK